MPYVYKVTKDCFYGGVRRSPTENSIVTLDKKLKKVPSYLKLMNQGQKTSDDPEEIDLDADDSALPEEPVVSATDQDVI